MRIAVGLLLVVTSLASFAEPEIDPGIYNHVSREAVVELAASAEAHFGRAVTSIAYVADDFPPVGIQAVSVVFSPKELPDKTYQFSSGLFYYSSWKAEWGPRLEGRNIELGAWTTPKDLNHQLKHRILVQGEPVFVSIVPPLTADTVHLLLAAVDSRQYSIGSPICPYPKITGMLADIGIPRGKALKAAEVHTAYRDKYENQDVIVLVTGSQNWWNFTHDEGSYQLVCVLEGVT